VRAAAVVVDAMAAAPRRGTTGGDQLAAALDLNRLPAGV